jgi:hypothetical protein
MNFDDLYTLALEAAKNFGSPKNIGGSRLAGVKQSQGPSGMVSSSVGKNDNPQERVPIDQRNKKGFDPKNSYKQQKSRIEVSDDSGNTEVRKKTKDELQNVFAIIGDQKKALYNSFALLNNSGYYKEQIDKIFEIFSTVGSIKLEDEKKLKNLRFSIDQNNSIATKMIDKIRQYGEVYNNYNDPEEVKIQTENDLEEAEALYDANFKNLKKIRGGSKLITVLNNLETLNMRKTLLLKNFASKTAPYEIEKLNSQIFNLEQKIKQLIAENPSYDQYVEKFKKLSRNIERLTVKHSHHKLKPSDVNGVEGKTNGILNILRNSETKLKAVEAKAKADSEEYNNLVDYVSKISTHNENINDTCIEKFKNAVVIGAKNILNLKFENFNPESSEAEQIDWDSDMPTKGDTYKMLVALTTPNNPIFRLINKLDMPFLDEKESEDETRGAVRYDIGRAMSDNENITNVRDINALPFSKIVVYLKNVDIATMPIKNDPFNNESFRKAYRQFSVICLNDENGEEDWNNVLMKERLKKLLGIELPPSFQTTIDVDMGDVLSDARKFEYEKIINGRYDNKGVGSFKKLLSMVDGDLRGPYPRRFDSIKNKLRKGESINESFDELAAKYASSFNLDINDFMIDLQEVHSLLESKCTGPTKKASSDRKGKKWTKCARQPDGSYKRIHWGQAGVRVGKNNPKRRKSFRARHKCSSAKSGSPKAAACGDW